MMCRKPSPERLLRPHTSDFGPPKACKQPTRSTDIKRDCIKEICPITTVHATTLLTKPLNDSSRSSNNDDYARPGATPTSQPYDPAWQNARSCLNNRIKMRRLRSIEQDRGNYTRPCKEPLQTIKGQSASIHSTRQQRYQMS